MFIFISSLHKLLTNLKLPLSVMFNVCVPLHVTGSQILSLATVSVLTTSRPLTYKKLHFLARHSCNLSSKLSNSLAKLITASSRSCLPLSCEHHQCCSKVFLLCLQPGSRYSTCKLDVPSSNPLSLITSMGVAESIYDTLESSWGQQLQGKFDLLCGDGICAI